MAVHSKTDILGTVVVPVLNEAERLESGMQALLSTLQQRWKVVVCDGGSEDATLLKLSSFPVTVVHSKPGRALQMNTGASCAEGNLLVFVHADSRLPGDFNALLEAFAISSAQWGRFDVALDDAGWPFPMIAWFINRRSALTGVCTGDQTLFMRRKFFENLQGYADIPLMEDVEFSLRARRFERPYRIAVPVTTSARRWKKNGTLKTVLLMWWLRLAYRLGVSPQRLHAWYYG